MKMSKQILQRLQAYSPQDFKQWKKDGLAELLFLYLNAKREELRKYILNEFDGCTIAKDKMDGILTRQAFAACLKAVNEVTLNDMIDFYTEQAND